MKIIRLTDEEFETLLNLLNYEFDQEWCYQNDIKEKDLTKLEDYLALYKKIYRSEYPKKYFLDNYVYNSLIESITNDIKELKQ